MCPDSHYYERHARIFIYLQSQMSSDMNKLRGLLILQTLIILALLAIAINANNPPKPKYGLLSPGVYADADPSVPKGFAIANLDPLQAQMDTFLSANKLNVSILVQNLKNGATMTIRSRQGFYAASLNKIPVAVLIMEKVEKGNLSMDTKLKVLDSDKSSDKGSIDSSHDSTHYSELTVRELVERMLRDSNNTALNVLFKQMDQNDMAALLDYYNIDFNSNYHYDRSRYQGNSKFITPRAAANMFSSLYFSTVLEPKNSEYILSLLTGTDFNLTEAAGLPGDVVLAHKYGAYYDDSTELFHDCGIMYIGKTRFLYCVMTSDIEFDNAKHLTSIVVNQTYLFITQTRARLDDYKKRFD